MADDLTEETVGQEEAEAYFLRQKREKWARIKAMDTDPYVSIRTNKKGTGGWTLKRRKDDECLTK